MRDFMVDLNGKILLYQVVLVGDSLYMKVDLEKIINYKDFELFDDFFYVYYFNVSFK